MPLASLLSFLFLCNINDSLHLYFLMNFCNPLFWLGWFLYFISIGVISFAILENNIYFILVFVFQKNSCIRMIMQAVSITLPVFSSLSSVLTGLRERWIKLFSSFSEVILFLRNYIFLPLNAPSLASIKILTVFAWLCQSLAIGHKSTIIPGLSIIISSIVTNCRIFQ